MSEITNRIDNILQLKKLKRVEMYREIGMSKDTYSSWIRGSIPNVENLFKVSKYLGVSLEYLVTGEEQDGSESVYINDAEKHLLQVFRHLDERDQNAVTTLAESLEKQYSDLKTGNISAG